MRILNNFYIFFYCYFLSIFFDADDNLTIYTSSGVTTGIEKKGVITWHDIPYAEPPTGELRWKAPRDFFNEELIISNKKITFVFRAIFILEVHLVKVILLGQKTVFI